jgi:MarR family transcriptional regulator, 2-MHQ and catechol-resistance regulon repressor
MKSTRQYGKKADTALTMWVKLARAYAVLGHSAAENIRSFGLTEPQFGVLETLGHLGPMLTGELGRKRLVSGGNVTVVVDNLMKQGLVERKVCTEDRRQIYVQLSTKGRRLFEKIFPKHADFIVSLVGILSEEEQQELGRLLKKLGVGVQTAKTA